MKKTVLKTIAAACLLVLLTLTLSGCGTVSESVFDGSRTADENSFRMNYTTLNREDSADLVLAEGEQLHIEYAHTQGTGHRRRHGRANPALQGFRPEERRDAPAHLRSRHLSHLRYRPQGQRQHRLCPRHHGRELIHNGKSSSFELFFIYRMSNSFNSEFLILNSELSYTFPSPLPALSVPRSLPPG